MHVIAGNIFQQNIEQNYYTTHTTYLLLITSFRQMKMVQPVDPSCHPRNIQIWLEDSYQDNLEYMLLICSSKTSLLEISWQVFEGAD